MAAFRFRLWWLPLCLLVLAGMPQARAQAPAAKGDLSVPVLEPKPLVWIEDWGGEVEVPAARLAATEHSDQADALKAGGEYAAAEKEYRAAIQADPTWAYPHYQLACNYELSKKSAPAAVEFDKAMELGLDDFPTALTDEELGKIRQRPDFNNQLKVIRQRYIASSPAKVGQPIAVRPKGEAPKGGWPVVLLLHGYGDSNVSYLDQAESWAAQGFLAVAVPGTIPINAGSYQWSNESVEPTQRDLQAILKSPLLKGIINPQKVFLMGFSQGALHALILASQKPEQYAGVVALSPGGSLAKQILNPTLTQKRLCVFVYGTKEPHAPIAALWKAACQKAGWKYRERVHPGGHQFPEDWEEKLPEIAKFLQAGI